MTFVLALGLGMLLMAVGLAFGGLFLEIVLRLVQIALREHAAGEPAGIQSIHTSPEHVIGVQEAVTAFSEAA